MFFKIQLFYILNICSPFNSINIFSVVHSPFPKWEMIGSLFHENLCCLCTKALIKKKKKKKQEKCFSNQYDLILLNQRPIINKPNASNMFCWSEKIIAGGRSQDGRGVGQGEHFLPHKFIKRAFKRWVNSTKQLLNAGRGHQAPRKAIQLFERR